MYSYHSKLSSAVHCILFLMSQSNSVVYSYAQARPGLRYNNFVHGVILYTYNIWTNYINYVIGVICPGEIVADVLFRGSAWVYYLLYIVYDNFIQHALLIVIVFIIIHYIYLYINTEVFFHIRWRPNDDDAYTRI